MTLARMFFMKPDNGGEGGGSASPNIDTSIDYNWDFGGITPVNPPEKKEEPAKEPEPISEGQEVTPEGKVADPKKDKPVQTEEQNKAFAELRREKEKYEKDLKKLNERAAKLFGEEFDVKDAVQYFDIIEKQIIEDREESLKEQGIDPAKDENHQKWLKELDTLKEAIAEKEEIIQKQDEVIQQKDQEALDKETIDAYNNLKKMYPQLVKSPTDLDDKTRELFEMGLDLETAFKTANMDKILDLEKKAAKQAALNEINSKKHLSVEGDGGEAGEDIHIGADTMQQYLDMGMTKAEAVAFHKSLYK